jgi:mercuric ion transport protein
LFGGVQGQRLFSLHLQVKHNKLKTAMKKALRILASAGLVLVAMPLMVQGSPAADPTIQTILSFWPFIIALVLLLLVVLWYQYIQTRKRARKSPERRHTARPNQALFLGIVTIFALIMLAMPWFLGGFEDKIDKQQSEQMIDPENRVEITLEVEGMTCTGCEGLIMRRVGEIPGVESVLADHMKHEATIVFDKSMTDRQVLAKTIEEAGYKVLSEKN